MRGVCSHPDPLVFIQEYAIGSWSRDDKGLIALVSGHKLEWFSLQIYLLYPHACMDQ